MKILAIIPARGGSKGVPRKNIIDINGKPLISYTITPALQAQQEGFIDEVIVSTDDEEIASISRSFGAKVPFLRPKELSSDTSKSVDLMEHAYHFFEKKAKHFDSLILLQPTSPLRTCADIELSIELFFKNDATSLISCYREENIHEFGLYHKEGSKAIALNADHNIGIRRQDMPDLFVRNGAIYIVKSEYMLQNKRVFDEIPEMYVMSKKRSLNIDTAEDIEDARKQLRREVL